MINEQTFKLLEKAIAASPEDWETRAHLIDLYLSAGLAPRAAALLKAAPAIPQTETDLLRQAGVELETDQIAAQLTLERVLNLNRASARLPPPCAAFPKARFAR